jgi:hypothetical protein
LLLEDQVVEFAAHNGSLDSLDEGAPHGRPLHAETTQQFCQIFARRLFVEKIRRN